MASRHQRCPPSRTPYRNRKGDWRCTTCDVMIFASKPKCFKCGQQKPAIVIPVLSAVTQPPATEPPPSFFAGLNPADIQGPVNHSPYGVWSRFAGHVSGYYVLNARGEGAPIGIRFPDCGCTELMHCPREHHWPNCRCYTCKGKDHKW